MNYFSKSACFLSSAVPLATLLCVLNNGRDVLCVTGRPDKVVLPLYFMKYYQNSP